jgi:hypothetical protein
MQTSDQSLQGPITIPLKAELGETATLILDLQARGVLLELKITTPGGSEITTYMVPGRPLQMLAGHDANQIGLGINILPHDEDKPELRLVRSTHCGKDAAPGSANDNEEGRK